MPINRGQGKPKRWYQLCFAPIGDRSDDSDTESVILPPNSTPTSTWQEISPPESSPPPSPPLPLPPPPPPPNFELPLPPPELNFGPPLRMPQPRLFYPSPNLEPPPPPLPIFSPPPPPSPPSQGNWTIAFEIESLSSYTSISPSPTQRFEVQDSVINAIHKVRISELHRRGEMSHCPICMEEFKVGDQACLLPCTHFYCSECILQWLRLSNNKTCPVCRLQLEGWEDHGGNSHSIDDTASAWDFFGHQNLTPPSPPLVIGVDQDWDYFLHSSPDSSVTENNSAGGNSDEADHYDSACEELGDNSLDLCPENSPPPPPPPPPIIPRRARSISLFSWENFYPSSPELATSATQNNGACEELGYSHEDGEIGGVC